MNITVTLTATPELLQVLQGLGSAIAPSSPAPKGKKQSTVMTLPDDKPAEEDNAKTQAVTLEQVRAAVQGKPKDKREKIKNLLSEFNATNVTTLASDKYAEFLEKLATI